MTTADNESVLGLPHLLVLGLALLLSFPFCALADSNDEPSEDTNTNEDSYFRLTSKDYAGLERQLSPYLDSYAARLARGIYLISYALSKRGSKFSHETTDEQIRSFVEQVKRAASDLQISIGLYSRPVESYRYLIQISMGLGRTGRGFLDEALKLDQQAYNPRFNYLY